MFKNLIRAPQRDAYDALKKKVEAAEAFRFPVPLSAHATLGIVCQHEQHVEDLLREREVLLEREGGMYRAWTIDIIERRVDESVAAARLLVRNLVCYPLSHRRMWSSSGRFSLLYAPREGNVPKISRSLRDETFMALGDGDADDDGQPPRRPARRRRGGGDEVGL